MAVGDRAVLLYPPGPEFILAFVGCLFAGVVPVPVYPPVWTPLHLTCRQSLSHAYMYIIYIYTHHYTTTPLLHHDIYMNVYMIYTEYIYTPKAAFACIA